MKLTNNAERLNVGGGGIITAETEKSVKKPAWIIIGDTKLWPRKCNHCGNVVYHTNDTTFYISRKHNKRCEKCRQPYGIENSFYGHKHTFKNIELYSRLSSGINNSMYGIGGMTGHKHPPEGIRRQQLARKKYWKERGHECTDAFLKYRWEVDRLTRKQPIHTLENVDKRGKAGIDGAYHLDHIKSVWYGYNKNIPACEIADITNLQFIPWMENQKKWYK